MLNNDIFQDDYILFKCGQLYVDLYYCYSIVLTIILITIWNVWKIAVKWILKFSYILAVGERSIRLKQTRKSNCTLWFMILKIPIYYYVNMCRPIAVFPVGKWHQLKLTYLYIIFHTKFIKPSCYTLSTLCKYISTIIILGDVVCVGVQTSHLQRDGPTQIHSLCCLPILLKLEHIVAHTVVTLLHYSTFKFTCHHLQLLSWLFWWHLPYPMSTSRKGSSEMTCGIPVSVPLFSPTPHDRPALTLNSTNQKTSK